MPYSNVCAADVAKWREYKMDITLYHFPGACSRVTMNALEEIGVEYSDRLVNIREMAQKEDEYLALNPKGKVPTLIVNGHILTENAAIIWTLHCLKPDRGLFPKADGPLASHDQRADLAWCSGTMHPVIRQVRMPMKWTTGDAEGVRAHGIETLLVECQRLSELLADGWWYGPAWSIVDTYLYWGYSTAEKGGFPLDRFPALLGHAERVRARPSFQRVLAREKNSLDEAGIDGIVL